MNISELKKSVGIQGIDVTGRVTKVFPRKEGTGDKGAWTLQRIELSDSTDSIICVLSNRKECPASFEGKTVAIFSPYVSKAGGKVGVRVVDKEKYGLQLRITPMAEVTEIKPEHDKSEFVSKTSSEDLKESIDALPSQVKENVLKIFDRMLMYIKDARHEVAEL